MNLLIGNSFRVVCEDNALRIVISMALSIAVCFLSSEAHARIVEVNYAAISAAEYGDIEVLEKYILTGLNSDHASSSGYTLLSRAAKHGQHLACEYLLNRGAEIEAVNLYGETPIMLAVQGGHVDTVQLLIRHGADINVRDRFNRSPLLYALVIDREDIARMLIDAGAEIGGFDGEQAVLWAVINKSSDFVDYLLGRGASPDASVNGHSALDIAINEWSGRAVTYLIRHGAKFGDNSIDRALSYAVGQDIPEIILALHARGADLNFNLYHSDNTPLQHAIMLGSERAFYALMDAKVDVNGRSLYKTSPLTIAVIKRRPIAWIKRLVAAGAELSESYVSYRRALGELCRDGHQEIARICRGRP